MSSAGSSHVNDKCPSCDSGNIEFAGKVYHPTLAVVAGVPIDLAGINFLLKRCRVCEFQFKRPQIPEEQLLKCYAQSKSDHWGETVDPFQRNFDRVKNAILRHADGRAILDVGCFNGAFLEFLGRQWERFGLEPSDAAGSVAIQRGVTLLGKTLGDIEPSPQFDVVVSMDVLEHVPRPADFFQRVAAMLRPGGIFVTTTGDAGAWSWRLLGSRYWYVSAIPEHISFYSRKTMQVLAQRSQMRWIEHIRMSHDRTSGTTKGMELAKNLSYAMLMRMGWAGIPWIRRKCAGRGGPMWMAATDHMINVVTKL